MTDAESTIDYRTHPDYLCGLAAVLSEPACDTQRLKLADWLDEHGEGERANVIRWMVTRPSWFADDTCFSHSDESPGYLNALEWFRNGNCDREMERVVGGAWGYVEGRWVWYRGLLVAQDMQVKYSRGFVSHVTLPSVDWFQHSASLYWSPEQTVPCSREGCRAGRVSISQWYSKRCDICSGTGLLPRPIPPTVQPLEVVRFTAAPVSSERTDGTFLPKSWLAKYWPRITFLFPNDADVRPTTQENPG